jgi:hypothetical protein
VDLAELSGLSKQVMPGADEEDEAVIAEVDHVRLDAIAAIDDFLQKTCLRSTLYSHIITLKSMVTHRLFGNPLC